MALDAQRRQPDVVDRHPVSLGSASARSLRQVASMYVEQGMMRPMSVRQTITSPMHRVLIISAMCCLGLAAVALPARGAWFEDATETLLGPTASWSNKIELADINGDGLIDILVANGGNYDSAGEPEMSGALVQKADGTFEDKSAVVFVEPG